MQTFKQPIGTAIEFKPSSIARLSSSRLIVTKSDSDYSFFQELEQQFGLFLDEVQLSAVRATKGPVLVLAGAGAGKTRVLISRTQYLIKHKKVNPYRIMLLTFSNKAAEVMKERLKEMLDPEVVEKMFVGTFHSIFLRMLRKKEYTQRIIGSKAEKQYILMRLLKAKKIDAMISPEQMEKKLSVWKNQLLMPSDVTVTSGIDEKMLEIYAEYEEHKLEKNLWDFDDILLVTRQYLINNPEYREELAAHFEHICVDEMQDSNNIQNEVVRMLTNSNANVMFVGDTRQVIYGFRNSSPKYIKKLSEHYPSIRTIYLTANYRSNPHIVGFSNYVLMQDEKPIEAVFEGAVENPVHFIRPKNSQEEAKWIREYILKKRAEGTKLSNFAILYRTNAYSRAVMEEFLMNDIPCKIKNFELFYDIKIVKQVLGYLILATNPKDAKAVVDVAPTLYIGSEVAQQQAYLSNDTHYGLKLLIPIAKDYQLKMIEARIDLIKRIAFLSPKTAIQEIRKTFYNRYMSTSAESSVYQDIMMEQLDELEQAASTFKTIVEFVQYIQHLRDLLDNHCNENDAVHIMTIHQSKGLEFDTVFVVGVSEGIIPHSASIKENQQDSILSAVEALEEENRILYVGVSRAENTLFVSSPKVHHGKPRKVSRFLIKENK